MEKWICEKCNIAFKKFAEEVNHLLDEVVCDKCYNKNSKKDNIFEDIEDYVEEEGGKLE
tara:strand:+ start:336 stop:512 length:177 start_codon:yes stop_codon:yes gene_type:complete